MPISILHATQTPSNVSKAKIGKNSSQATSRYTKHILMKVLIFIALAFFTTACSPGKNAAGRTFDAITTGNETLQLKHDTLYSSTGRKFFTGQQLVVGNAAGEDGYYRSIVYKTAIVPSIWGQDMRYDHAIENHVNVKKSREGVKRLLVPGKIVIIKGIGLWSESRPHFYIVSLAAGNEVFGCDLQFALELGELAVK